MGGLRSRTCCVAGSQIRGGKSSSSGELWSRSGTGTGTGSGIGSGSGIISGSELTASLAKYGKKIFSSSQYWLAIVGAVVV